MSRDGWRECKLGDVAKFKTGKLNSNAAAADGIYPFFTCSPETLKIDNYAFDEEALLLAGNNANGVFSLKYFHGKFNAYQRTYIINLNNSCDYKYIFYALQKEIKNLEFTSHGTATKFLTLSILNTIPILLPSISKQKAIVSILSSLDDKIDLLNRQNKTLKAMAETLFRQWFVEEADERWEEKPLSDIAEFLNGLACQNYPPVNDNEKLPVLKIRELSSGISEQCDWATTDVSKNYIIHNGDVIFSWSASLMVKIWDGGDCILNQHLFKVSSKEYPKWFYFGWCKYHLEEFIAIAQTHATTMGHIKRGDLDAAMVVVPLKKELETMTKQMYPLLEKQIGNSKQINALMQMRDMVLPKLMSGEVSVD
ncbi:restriction endonuclease subunit S [Leadbettera azotonutricia]|nr:restriction endonuclease subunit S [Leadbettera azotonutricia]